MRYIRLLCMSVALLLTLTCGVSALSELDYDYTLSSRDSSQRVPIPRCYMVSGIVTEYGDERESFGEISDLFVDGEDNVYLLDKENNKIIKLDSSGRLAGVFDNSEEKGFSSPGGMFVDENGNLFVADTNNKRIVMLDSEGDFVREYTKPAALLETDPLDFAPTKIAVSKHGYIYVMRYQQLMSLNMEGEFVGYIGASKVTLSMSQRLFRIFASKEMKDKMVKIEPPAYTNFIVGEDQLIYASTQDTARALKKLNTVGINILPEAQYGEPLFDSSYAAVKTVFMDLAADNNGIISAIEQNTKKIYQYSPAGDLLAVTAGNGTATGMLENPKAIEVDSRGRLYVYDENKGLVIYEPTEFIRSVHNAIAKYDKGEYADAKEHWAAVLQICETYSPAHHGIGKALLKEGELAASMEEFQMADDKEGYSQAYDKLRQQWFEEHFILLFSCIAGVIVVLFLLLKYWKRFSTYCEYTYKRRRGRK